MQPWVVLSPLPWGCSCVQGQQPLLKIAHRKDLEWGRERGSSNWHVMRKSQLSLHIFAVMAGIKLRCAKHTPAFGPTTYTISVYLADSLRPHWSRQHCQGQVYTDELFHIILRMGNKTYPPLAPPIQGGITFLEWLLKNKVITTWNFSFLWCHSFLLSLL